MEDTIKLMSKEGEVFEALASIAAQSKTLSNLMKETPLGEPVALPSIPSATLAKVVAFCMHETDDPRDESEKKEEEDPALKLDDPNHVLDKPYPLTEWDTQYLTDLDQGAVFELILAANYLDVSRLVKVCARKIALSVLGKTPKEIYAMFGVDKDLTPEEEEEVIKENPWLADK